MPSGPIPSRISDSDIEFIFRFVDTLSIGYINRDQFHRALYALGWNTVDYGDVRMLLEIAGKHPQNGLLNQSEFATIVKQNQFKSDSPEEIDAAFRLFDQNRTGYITAENLRNVWEMVTGRTASMTTKSVTAAAVSNRDGPTTTASGDVLVRDILHAFDTNRDGVLDLKEFRTAVAPHLYPPEGAAAAPRSTSASSSPKARSNRNDKTVCSSDSKMLPRSNSRGLLTTGSGSGSFSTLTSKPKLETFPRSSSRNSLEKQASTPKYQRSSSQPTLDEKIEEMHRATSSNNMSRSSFLGLSSMVGVGSKSDLLQEEPPHESSAVAPRTHNSFRTIVPTTTRSPSASYQPFSGLEGNRSGSFSNIMHLYGEDRLASSNQSPPLRETSPTMNRTPAVEAVPSPTPSKGNTTDLAKGYTIQEEDNITYQTSPKQASYQNATASTRNKTRTMSQRSGSFDMSRTVGISTSPKSNPSTPMNFTKNTVSFLQKTSSNLQTKTDSRKTSSAKMKSPNAPVAVYGTGTGTSFRQSSDNNTLVANHSATSKKAEDVGEWYCPITYVAGGAFEMDRNNGTCASRTSIRTALEDLGFDANILSAADFDRHFDALDQNRDGALTQEEVFALVSSLQ